MYKRLLGLLMFFLTLSLNSQNIVLLKNFNPKAKGLKHYLNKTRDSLILKGNQNILQVDIFNEDFDKTVLVENSEVKIKIDDVPIGEFVIEAKLDDRTIIMELIRYDSSRNTSVSSKNNDFVYERGTMLDENLNTIKSIPKHNIEGLLSPAKSRVKRKFFWVVLKTPNTTGSRETSMKLVNEIIAQKMIKKNKLLLSKSTERFNELTVWEVYDASKFMQAQLTDPNYINSTSSDLFNVIPFYITTENRVAAK